MTGACWMPRLPGQGSASGAREKAKHGLSSRTTGGKPQFLGARKSRRIEEAYLVHTGCAAGLPVRHLHSAARHRPQYLGAGVQIAGRRHPRHVQHVRGRRHPPHGDLCAEHHAVHFGLDHHSIADHGVADARSAEEGRRGRPQDAEPVHPLPHRHPGRVPVLRHRGRARRRRQCRQRSRHVLPALDRDHADGRHHVPDVARRADHLARHRERYFADHSLRHRRGAALGARQHAGTRPSGRAVTGLILIVIVMAIAVIAFIVFMERAQRRLLIQYPKRQVGNKMFEGQVSHLPLKLNTSGVIPPIFASSLLLLPTTVANFNAGKGPEWFQWITTQLGHGRPLFLVMYLALIVFFAFFYTAIVFNPTETADNLKKHGGFIPGIRPGERTAEYIDYVLSRITVVGAGYLAIVCIIPEILISYASVPFYFGGTSLLIVVSVTMDTVAQVQGYLLAHQYEGLIRKSKLRGRNR